MIRAEPVTQQFLRSAPNEERDAKCKRSRKEEPGSIRRMRRGEAVHGHVDDVGAVSYTHLPVKERIAKLRDEIAQISEANRLYLTSRTT